MLNNKVVVSNDPNISVIDHWLKKARQRYLLAFALKILPLLFLLAIILVFSYNNIADISVFSICLTLWLFAIYLRGFTKGYQLLNRENFLFHLNRNFANLEESAQLLLMPLSELSLLQRLQKEKTALAFNQLNQNEAFDQLLPKIIFTKTIAAFVVFIVVINNAAFIKHWLTDFFTPQEITTVSTVAHGNAVVVSIVQRQLMIEPPSYTKLAKTEQNSLDLELVEGSEVSWFLQMSVPSQSYQLVFSDGTRLALVKNEQNVFTAKAKIATTSFYRIAYGPENIALKQVYAISVIKDTKPKITILSPVKAVTEIAKNGNTEFTSQALIKDDYGIGKVHILASVAKGSGEGVKFRDQQFEFESRSITGKGELFEKKWQLTDLGMEPGDEVYLTVYATDNKKPSPQQNRSATFIVRWLDEEQAVITAEGIVIDFIPEYFRSQRQIIIETEQLINDQAQLSTQQFSEISEELGRSQSDLKQRYGQYLGDEFGEGAQAEFTGIEDIDHHEDGHESEQDKQLEAAQSAQGGHVHQQSQTFADKYADKSGARTLMARFGHDHGEADIGPVLKKNPKALMKRAVSVMWQAELHLMLSEPIKALPYEKEAYKYLKLAKQADRIYVKRLGFEPPPVKENKRLTGELDDILTYSQQANLSLNIEQDRVLFSRVFTSLSSHFNRSEPLSNEQQALFELAKVRITALAQQRPALIKQAVTLERILVANNIAAVNKLSSCKNCLNELRQKLWQLIPNAIAKPSVSQSMIDQQNPLYLHYQQQAQSWLTEKPPTDTKAEVN